MSAFRSIAWCAMMAAGVVVAGGCGAEEGDGPPTLRAGRDQCAECGMIINEERYAAGTIIEESGRREPLLFDDIGCLFDYHRDRPELRVVSRWVRNEVSREWMDAGSATLVHAASIHTPMGSGLAAFGSRDEALERLGSDPGTVMTLEEAAGFRERWMVERFGRPVSAPVPAQERPSPGG